MSFSLSPLFNGWQGFGFTGLPLNAGQLFTYQAGTTTPVATYTTSIGNVPNANPIILGADGRPPQEIWLQDGLSYKFVLMDSLSNLIATYDNIQSIGTLIQNFVTSTAFLTQSDGRYPIYVGTAGGSADALTATVATSITALYNGMVVSLDAIAANATATPTFTLTLGSTVTSTFTIVDYNLQPLQAGAIAGVGHKIFLGCNSIQGKWVLMNPQPAVASAGTVSRRQTALVGPVDMSGFPSWLPQAVTGLTLTTKNIVGVETSQTSTITFSAANPTTATWASHTLVANQAISFTTTGALPGGLVAGTIYYVVNPATNTFQVAATPGGAAIGNGAGSGTQTALAGVQIPLTATGYFGNDGVTGELNVVGQATANFSFPILTNNTTNYLYSTISTLGIFTHVATTIAPIIFYGPVITPSVSTVNGQVTIDVVRGESYIGNGAAAIETPLIYWGTATTSAGNITATQLFVYGKPPTFTGKASGSLLKRTVYSTAGTFTWIKSAQTTSINIKVKGGGGAGGPGGTGSAGSAPGAGGGGGGEGGYAEGLFDASLFIIQTISLASAGSSSVGSLISATAGATGGTGSSAGGAATVNGGIGGAGGTGTGGDVQLSGQAGISGFPGILGTTNLGGNSGTGGGNGGGVGALGTVNAGATGGVGTNGGGGGGGAGGGTTVTTAGTGAAGSVGYVIIDEYA